MDVGLAEERSRRRSIAASRKPRWAAPPRRATPPRRNARGRRPGGGEDTEAQRRCNVTASRGSAAEAHCSWTLARRERGRETQRRCIAKASQGCAAEASCSWTSVQRRRGHRGAGRRPGDGEVTEAQRRRIARASLGSAATRRPGPADGPQERAEPGPTCTCARVVEGGPSARTLSPNGDGLKE
eukprot:10655097-Heterocapsa_arctica.AAC.1